jgi:hypothetical protein
MAGKKKYDPLKDPRPYPELSWKQLELPENAAKFKEVKAWSNRVSYHKNGGNIKRSNSKFIKRHGSAMDDLPAPGPAPKPISEFKDDAEEFNRLLSSTPLNEPFEVAANTAKPGVKEPKQKPPADNYDPDFGDDEEEFSEPDEEPDSERARPGPDYVNMTDAKAYLFVRLSNFGTAIVTKMLYWCVGFDTDMEAMKVSDKDVETMAEDAKWFIDDVGMTPQQMFMFSMCGTVAMNGFYTAKKQEHPWWDKFGKKKPAPGSGAGPFKVNDDDNNFYEAEVM